MSGSSQQMFLRHTDVGQVTKALRAHVSEHTNEFLQCAPYTFGVDEVLAGLLRTKREFWLLQRSVWTVIWEVVYGTGFVDPAIAKILSRDLETEAIWFKIDDNYNIWANQTYSGGELSEEVFLPITYFEGDPESDLRNSYGSCREFADDFNESRELPCFLMTPNQVERDRRLASMITKVVCRFPRSGSK